jgi:serine/threonine-protein kinase
VDGLFKEEALRRGALNPGQIERAEALQAECRDEISPWLHHCLVAQDSLTEGVARAVLKAIEWEDQAFEEKVEFLRRYVGNMNTLTEFRLALLHGETLFVIQDTETGTPKPAPPPEAPVAEPAVPPGPPPPPEPGGVERMIISFKLGEKIAEDPISRTFKARDRLTGRLVALRILKASAREKGEVVNRFLNEGRIVAAINHPNIMPVYGMGVMRGGLPFMASHFFRGVNLLQVVLEARTGKRMLPRLRMLNLFIQIGQAVRGAHFKSVVHRHLHPGNIFLGKAGEIVVGGWRFAKVFGEPDLGRRDMQQWLDENVEDTEPLTDDKKRCALAYLAPEIVEMRLRDVGETTDVYGLGGLLFFLLSGMEPVGGVSAAEILDNITRAQLLVKSEDAPTPGVPESLLSVCKKALAYEREDRHPGVEALLDDLMRRVG